MEAVERLAARGRAGGAEALPEPAEAERRRHDLPGVLEAARRAIQRRLLCPKAARALDYLRGRGLTDETIRRLRPWLVRRGPRRAWQPNWRGEGDRAATCWSRPGCCAKTLKPAAAYELFFNRVMFPIRDRRGRGHQLRRPHAGRRPAEIPQRPGNRAVLQAPHALRPGPWRASGARAAREIVVVEGYMDVIALHQAGFAGAVAPLGTALTEEQLGELWRLTPAPILCFDGDAAGRRAAARAADLALPLLAPERTLRMATLPDGEDPDTLVTPQAGRPAFAGGAGAARPLAEALFDLMREAVPATRHAGAARGVAHAAGGGRARASPTAPWPANTAARCSTVSSPTGAGQQGAAGSPARMQPAPVPLPLPSQRRDCRSSAAAHPDRHPAAPSDLLPDVEHAFAASMLPPPCDRCATRLLDWADARERA